jgi:poly(3-hydroxyalkanoate) synthetase
MITVAFRTSTSGGRACSGGITVSALLANMAARRKQKDHSATIAVCLLDMAVAEETTVPKPTGP